MEIKKYTDFMCNCKPEGKKRCDEVVESVCQELQCEPANMLSAVVYDCVSFDNAEAYIEGINADQWAMIRGSIYQAQEGFKNYQKIATLEIQCDQLEAGVARFYQLCKEIIKQEEVKENV